MTFPDVNLHSRLFSMKDRLYQLFEEIVAMVVELEELANNLDKLFKKISIGKVGGSVAAIVGGILAAIGIGLSFVTFGASLGLCIAGGVIGGVGGMVVSGSQIYDAFKSEKKRRKAENIETRYQSRVEFLIKEYVEIRRLLQNYGDIDVDFPSWDRFWRNCAIISGFKSGVWNVLVSNILHVIRITSYVDDVMSTGAAITTTVFKTIGSTTFRVLHIAGGVAGIVFLIIDIITLYCASRDIYKTNPHKTSEAIREIAAQIRAKCPTREDIDGMVEETVANLSHV